MNPKVSVVIPVYNAENYIAPCIESLLNQTLEDCEFIFVNDGSIDRSRQIIEDYRLKDNRIRLIDQANEGVSAARNAGLAAATGEYIGFVDADDTIDAAMYETLHAAACKGLCDVIVSNFESELDGHKVVNQYPFPEGIVLGKEFIQQEILPYFLKSEQLNTACNKLYKHAIIQKYRIQFPYRVPLGEDGLFNMQFFSQAQTMQYINYTGYYYREVTGSATRNIAQKDYFARAIEVYTSDLPHTYVGGMDLEQIKLLRSIKLIQSVMSYIFIYFKASRDLSFSKRYRRIRQMIHHPKVREALPYFYKDSYSTLGRYERFITDMIRSKSMIGLYCATAYSRARSK